MKSKKEILAMLKTLREGRDSYLYLKSKPFADISNGQIRALRWVLGYEVGEWYWCFSCEIQHKGLKCPKCGNETLIEPMNKKW